MTPPFYDLHRPRPAPLGKWEVVFLCVVHVIVAAVAVFGP